jgi:hypothetical protein
VSIVAIELRRKGKDGLPSLDGDHGPGGILVNGGSSRARFPAELTEVLAVLELSSVMIDLFPLVEDYWLQSQCWGCRRLSTFQTNFSASLFRFDDAGNLPF